MVESSTTVGVSCASYTHARRHPMVLGRIAGWTPPFQLSVVQIAVLLGGYATVTWTWRFWGPLLPGPLGPMLAMGVPPALAWVARRVRVEGRGLARAALGWVMLWSAPTSGQVGGRPAGRARPARWCDTVSYLRAGEP